MKTTIGLERFSPDRARGGGRYGLVTNPPAIMGDERRAWRVFMDGGLTTAFAFGQPADSSERHILYD